MSWFNVSEEPFTTTKRKVSGKENYASQRLDFRLEWHMVFANIKYCLASKAKSNSARHIPLNEYSTE